jgi:hypothetical protein
MRKVFFCFGLMVFVGLCLWGEPAVAQTKREFWSKADIWYRLNPRTRLLLMESSVRNEDGDKTNATASIWVDYRENRRYSCRFGYSHLMGLSGEGDRRTLENRISGDFVAAFWLNRIWVVTDRNRLEFRDYNDGSSAWRYRNRLHADGIGRIGSEEVAPFVSLEAFVNEGAGGVNRWRAETGLNIRLSPHFIPGFYRGWQTDTRPRRNTFVGFGLALQFIDSRRKTPCFSDGDISRVPRSGTLAAKQRCR